MVARGVTRRLACEAVGRPRASHYRAKQDPIHGPPCPRPRSHRALGDDEVDRIVSVLTSERFCDQAPAKIWATLLDEGTYLASVSTMYRELRKRSMVRERRAQARRPAHIKPELVATAPNEVWSWDITKLAGPHKWTWFQLYVILDVYSRYAVNWLVAPRESARLAEELIADAIHRHQVPHGQLTLHADRGSSMTSKTVSQLLADLGVLQSHSRPASPTTTPTAKPSSRPSNTRRGSPKSSHPSPSAGPSSTDSSSTTTTNTATPAPGSTPQPTSTTAEPTRSANNDKPSSTPPTTPDPTDSDNHHARPASLRQHGSTNHRRRP